MSAEVFGALCAFTLQVDVEQRRIAVRVNASPQIAWWRIDPGDGSGWHTGIPGKEFTYQYHPTVAGSLPLTVEVIGMDGDTVSQQVPLVLEPIRPQVSLCHMQTGLCAMVIPTFSTPVGIVTEVVLDWGDGARQTEITSDQTYQHCYMASGERTITLTVQDDRGEYAVATVPLLVACDPPTCRIADWFTLDRTLSILVEADTTTDGDAISDITIDWDELNDDGQRCLTSGCHPGAWAHHTYRSSAPRTITVVASNCCGQRTSSLPQRIETCAAPIFTIAPGQTDMILPQLSPPASMCWITTDGTDPTGLPVTPEQFTMPIAIAGGQTIIAMATHNASGGQLASPVVTQHFTRRSRLQCHVAVNALKGATVTLQITSVIDHAAESIPLLLDWGDGEQTDVIIPAGSSYDEQTVCHTYTAAGVFQVQASAPGFAGICSGVTDLTVAVPPDVRTAVALEHGGSLASPLTQELPMEGCRPWAVRRAYSTLYVIGSALDDAQSTVISRYAPLDGRLLERVIAPVAVDRDSHFILWYGNPHVTTHTAIQVISGVTGEVLRTFGDGLFTDVTGMTEADGLLYISDSGANRIFCYTPEGECCRSWSAAIDDDKVPGQPYGITVNDGLVYVTDTANRCIKVFSPDGVFLRRILGLWQADEIPMNLTKLFGHLYCHCTRPDGQGDRIFLLAPDDSLLDVLPAPDAGESIPTYSSMNGFEGYLTVLDAATKRLLVYTTADRSCDHQTLIITAPAETSDGEPVIGWRWNPGDDQGWRDGIIGQTSRYRTLAHYTDDRTITIETTTGSGDGQQVICPVNLANQPPQATLSLTATGFRCDAEIDFSDPDGIVMRATLDWGDGTISPALPQALFTHHYTTAGTYSVLLTVVDDDGAVTTVSQTCTLSEE